MAADRTNTQTLITLHADGALAAAAESARKKAGKSRSQWIREAILEKAEREGIPLPPELARAPDRAGKGGRPKVPAPQYTAKRTVTLPETKALIEQPRASLNEEPAALVKKVGTKKARKRAKGDRRPGEDHVS